MEEFKMPLIGDKFPNLEVQTTRGKKKLPDAFKGKWFILFSHPADFTPVCTTEFVSFQKRYKDFKKLSVCQQLVDCPIPVKFEGSNTFTNLLFDSRDDRGCYKLFWVLLEMFDVSSSSIGLLDDENRKFEDEALEFGKNRRDRKAELMRKINREMNSLMEPAVADLEKNTQFLSDVQQDIIKCSKIEKEAFQILSNNRLGG